MNDKNLRYHEQGLAQKFGGKFVSKLEKLLDKSNISDDILVEGIYDYVQEIYDRQDCQTWLIDQGLDSLADNKEFCKAWKEITAEAERLRDEEDGDYNDKEEDD